MQEAADDSILVPHPPVFDADARSICNAFSNQQYNHPLDGAYENLRTAHSPRLHSHMESRDLKYPIFFSRVPRVRVKQTITHTNKLYRKHMTASIADSVSTATHGPVVDATEPPHAILSDTGRDGRLLLVPEPRNLDHA